MRKFSRPLTIAINLILGFITVAIWIAFAPLKVGGQASYVMITGNSMEPNFWQDDLAIIKAASTYKIGDVITYKDPQLDDYIIHRIIGIEENRFIIQGDNNTWLDPFEPTEKEILGKLWIHVPKLGLVFRWLRVPINMTFVVCILGGVLMIGQNNEPNKKGKKNKPRPESSSEWFEMALYTIGFFVLAFLVMSIFFFSKPATRAADDLKYEQTGVYYYSAAMPPGIFDTETLHSGEPIFTRLTCSIIIGYSYNISGPVKDVSGTQQLNVNIKDWGSGWGRTFPLTASTTFNGTSFSTTAPIDLCQFQELVKTLEEKTGFQLGTTLTVISQIAVSAKTSGQPVYDTFESKLTFQFDGAHFYMVNNSEADPFQSSKSSVIANPNMEANTVKFMGYELNVMGMRALGVGGLSLSLLGLSILGLYIYGVSKRSPEALIRIRYGGMLMDVDDRSFENISPVIEVTSIDDLSKLAERQNAMILHTTRDLLHYYFVQSDGATYRFINKKDLNRQTISTTRHETLQAITPPIMIDPDLDNVSRQNTDDGQSQQNQLPKKITIAYNGPLPYNEKGEPELPLTNK